jgi:hypothetical protein
LDIGLDILRIGKDKKKGGLKLESIVETPNWGPPSKQGQELGSM